MLITSDDALWSTGLRWSLHHGNKLLPMWVSTCLLSLVSCSSLPFLSHMVYLPLYKLAK